jgi:hypothetical protein
LSASKRCAALAHRGDHGAEAVRQWLTGEFSQQRLGIEGVEVARPAFHEEKDHALCAGELNAARWAERARSSHIFSQRWYFKKMHFVGRKVEKDYVCW